mmetsp:Transcript_10500/g.9045  ORF Transcript_10500/g.9045 Transcript_10500/m.9045 type:complete len:160 (+) Transcript_10500:51-530(+)|eukprot:CAMPEP_0114590742 /NCGR_PEP_ID=MMETSP0125-20121206/12947_1 /TAXON_ID=485358 ORGANISM="Aristerostoma sp., Strain ATCC 50986" /NCGR_SAMPLE_ID=MMETSP0125 /ASSEMBLY_ACC=CAM_ASM_000245 /LENGTH=159 /DNA_ID=CAMNT_0001788447 /DNA_START=46 /DNA_END=525 /DNA_ORIENTATION=-
MSDDETFEKVDSGASQTVPKQIGNLKKGDYAILKGHPCKIMEITTAKTGKHGHAKASITGIDVFTGNKVEDGGPTSHNIDVPNVDRKEYTLVDIANDGFLSLMKEDGDMKEDLKLPETSDDAEMVTKLKADFGNGKDLLISVISAMGKEKVVSYRETTN